MFGLGMGELLVILVLVLIVLGPSKLPQLASSLGKAMREFRKASLDIREEIDKDGELAKPFRELREAVTLPPEELRRRDELRKQMELVTPGPAPGTQPVTAAAPPAGGEAPVPAGAPPAPESDKPREPV